jgi:hypothetical protein
MVALTACVPVMAAGCATVQAGGFAAPEFPMMAQASVTFPVKPELGVTEIVAGADAPAVRVTADPVNEKDGLPPEPALIT